MRFLIIIGLLIKINTPLISQKIAAHRGYSKEYPENSLESIKAAIQFNFDAIELDVLVTKDDVLILHHDLDIVGAPNAIVPTIQINSLTYNELQAVNSKKEKTSGKNDHIIPIATLAEALTYIVPQDIDLILDLKVDEIEKDINLLLKSHKIQLERLKFIVYRIKQAKKVRELFKEATIYFAVSDIKDFTPSTLSFLKNIGVQGLSINNKTIIDDNYCSLFKSLEFELAVWNISNVNELNYKLSLSESSYILMDRPLSQKESEFLFFLNRSDCSENSYSEKSTLSILASHLFFNNYNKEETGNFQLISTYGKKIYETTVIYNHIDLSLINLPTGIYYAYVYTNKEQYTLKFRIK